MILEKRIPARYILSKVKYDVIAVLLTGLITHYFSTIFSKVLPQIPLAIPAFLGTAISILLSFKMNQSYDRWWEARKVWGAIVNDSRTLVIQLQSYLTERDHDTIKRIAYRQIAWCYSLGAALRGNDPLKNTDTYLSNNEKSLVGQHTNKPLAILHLNANELKELRTNQQLEMLSHIQLDNTLVRLCDAMGRAERINSTVFPSTYRKFLHFIIYIFIVTLSIALKDVEILLELPLLILISIGFFLIEKSAYHLQDPFRNRPSDVPVTAIARTIEINLRQLIGEKEVPQPVKPDGFYIL